MPPAVEAWSSNHWTTRELPVWFLLTDCIQVFCLGLHFVVIIIIIFLLLNSSSLFFLTDDFFFFAIELWEFLIYFGNEFLSRYMVCKYLLLIQRLPFHFVACFLVSNF